MSFEDIDENMSFQEEDENIRRKKIEEKELLGIYIKNVQGDTDFFEVCIDQKIGELIEQYKKIKGFKSSNKGFKSSNIIFTFKGKRLFGHETFEQAGIQNEDTIHVLIRLKAGGLVFPFVNVRKETDKRGFSNRAPKWRVVSRGLNLLGICESPQCQAKGKEVICPMKFESYNFIKDKKKVKCPICGNIVVPETCGFFLCRFKFTGKIYENGTVKDFTREGESNDEDNWDCFSHKMIEDDALYFELSVETYEL